MKHKITIYQTKNSNKSPEQIARSMAILKEEYPAAEIIVFESLREETSISIDPPVDQFQESFIRFLIC